MKRSFILLGVRREYGNILYRGYIGNMFSSSLLTTSKLWGSMLFRWSVEISQKKILPGGQGRSFVFPATGGLGHRQLMQLNPPALWKMLTIIVELVPLKACTV